VGIRRIAVVASTFRVGGAEIVTANVLRRLSRERFETRLYFLHQAGQIGRELLTSGFGGVQQLCKVRRDPLAIARLATHLHRFSPDVVFCLDHADAMWFGRTAALFTPAGGVVIASHSTGLVGRNGRVRPSFGTRDRVLMEFTSRVVAVSRSHARYLREVAGLPRERIAVIENGIELDEWPEVTPERRRDARAALAIAPGDEVVAMVAAMRPEKAHEDLLRAVVLLKESGRRVRVLLAGDGERRGALERHAESLGVSDQVVFLGIRRDVARLLHACDVVVLPSRAVVETLPLSILEAMASGAPVVATRVGSVPDLVQDGITGLLIAPESPVELADAIAYTLEEPGRARERSRRARAVVAERHDIRRTVAGYEALFEQVATVSNR